MWNAILLLHHICALLSIRSDSEYVISKKQLNLSP
jgi:hypothetical protein